MLIIIALFSTHLFLAQETYSEYDISIYFEEHAVSSIKEKENEKRFNKVIALYSKLKKG
jgi:hypothetical protein